MRFPPRPERSPRPGTWHGRRLAAALALVAAVGACGPAPQESGINDPYEADNRRIHRFNKSLDSALVGPGADAYGSAVPEPARRAVGNFASNVDLPRMVVNGLLQGRLEDALSNSFRFVINSTLGLAGLFDPATGMGVPVRETDFGETLHVWGWGEGRYLELPVFGPATERDALGKVVDFGLNPLRYALPDSERQALMAVGIASRFGDRYRFSGTVESILYESADSYAQARLLYLQNRRFELGGDEGIEYADPYEDPYFDPYEDPYVE